MKKYVLYAVGEIMLVVIGILIALQIDDWNEEQNNQKEEVIILTALQSDFLESKERLDLRIKEQQSAIYLSRRLLTAYENNESFDIDSLPEMIFQGVLAWFRFEPVTGTYDAIIGTGKLGLIQNDKIRAMLASYYADTAPGFEDQEVSVNLINSIYQELGKDILPLRDSLSLLLTGMKPFAGKLEIHAKSIMNNRTFFGLLYGKTFIEGFRLNYYLGWKFRIEELQSIIAEEINRLAKTETDL